MEKIYFTNIDNMIESIKQYAKDNCTYVEACDDIKFGGYYGWICPIKKIYFCMTISQFNNQKGIDKYRYLDSFLKRKIASIYLSNCSNDKAYNFFKEKINKMKAFW